LLINSGSTSTFYRHIQIVKYDQKKKKIREKNMGISLRGEKNDKLNGHRLTAQRISSASLYSVVCCFV